MPIKEGTPKGKQKPYRGIPPRSQKAASYYRRGYTLPEEGVEYIMPMQFGGPVGEAAWRGPISEPKPVKAVKTEPQKPQKPKAVNVEVSVGDVRNKEQEHTIIAYNTMQEAMEQTKKPSKSGFYVGYQRIKLSEEKAKATGQEYQITRRYFVNPQTAYEKTAEVKSYYLQELTRKPTASAYSEPEFTSEGLMLSVGSGAGIGGLFGAPAGPPGIAVGGITGGVGGGFGYVATYLSERYLPAESPLPKSSLAAELGKLPVFGSPFRTYEAVRHLTSREETWGTYPIIGTVRTSDVYGMAGFYAGAGLTEKGLQKVVGVTAAKTQIKTVGRAKEINYPELGVIESDVDVIAGIKTTGRETIYSGKSLSSYSLSSRTYTGRLVLEKVGETPAKGWKGFLARGLEGKPPQKISQPYIGSYKPFMEESAYMGDVQISKSAGFLEGRTMEGEFKGAAKTRTVFTTPKEKFSRFISTGRGEYALAEGSILKPTTESQTLITGSRKMPTETWVEKKGYYPLKYKDLTGGSPKSQPKIKLKTESEAAWKPYKLDTVQGVFPTKQIQEALPEEELTYEYLGMGLQKGITRPKPPSLALGMLTYGLSRQETIITPISDAYSRSRQIQVPKLRSEQLTRLEQKQIPRLDNILIPSREQIRIPSTLKIPSYVSSTKQPQIQIPKIYEDLKIPKPETPSIPPVFTPQIPPTRMPSSMFGFMLPGKAQHGGYDMMFGFRFRKRKSIKYERESFGFGPDKVVKGLLGFERRRKR